ncbi:uncharacterized protein LOC108478063 [Gossypium arboreum]|uniref:uncharacterized protein LOC108478063 n=1 Tax=Gossypium arboreum TaxID=29729 RepID=UPI0008194D7B|nr:uncharacterized protein LOC108478063 [Gossypium arboreum]
MGNKDPKLINYRELVLDLIRVFDDITFYYLPRDENQMADALVTLAFLIRVNQQEDMKPIQMSICKAPAHYCNIDEEEERDDCSWYNDILRYVKNREYPNQATGNDKRMLRRLASDYVLDGEILYKKRKDRVLLRCVNAVEAKKILKEVHEGVCGTHANGFTMAGKIMRFEYFWSTIEEDCISYSKKCHKCKIYGDKIHVPLSPLHVKAASYANVTKSAVSKFLKKEIICRYGMPERIIFDKVLNLNNSVIVEICRQFKIKHHNSSPYHPKMNGVIEAANKNIKKIVGKMTETYKDCHEKLPFALYAYRISVMTSTRATPYSLVYGMEAVLPIEVEIPSLRVLLELKLDEAEWIHSQKDIASITEMSDVNLSIRIFLIHANIRIGFEDDTNLRSQKYSKMDPKVAIGQTIEQNGCFYRSSIEKCWPSKKAA